MQDSIGPYQISGELGRGGMGVVYRGHDARLSRDVAIKALPPEFAADPSRLERFEREAKSLASLSSANVGGIYGVEEADGARYLVLELVEGETLAERLDRGPLPLDEAVELSSQIAAGIEAAHEAGVIHRDLKPANIKITPEGVAKVLDFGLARADEGQSQTGSSEAVTLTTPHHQTSPGMIVGTAAYMSPEQARGRRVDKRTDIWSFGVILYEMLAGASPFIGETATDSIGAVLHKDPDLNLLPPQTPANVRRVLERCLERDKNQRYRDIGDVRIELLRSDPEGETAPAARKRGSFWIGFTSAATAAIATALVATRLGAPPPPEPPPPIRFAFPFGEVVGGDDVPARFAISPTDRYTVAWAGTLPGEDVDAPNGVCIHDLRTGESTKLPGTDGANYVSFSPDGSQIAFYHIQPGNRDDEIRRVATAGGPVVTVARIPTGGYYAAAFLLWDRPGSILLAKPGPLALARLSVDTGLIEELGEVEGFNTVFGIGGPTLAGESTLLFGVLEPTGSSTVAINLETLEGKRLVPGGGVAFMSGDRLVHTQGRTIFSAPFDPEEMEFTGARTPVLTGLASEFSFVVSKAGDLLALRTGETGVETGRQVYIMDRQGDGSPVIDARRSFTGNAVPTPDGSAVAVTIVDSIATGELGGYIIDRATGAIEPMVDPGGVFSFNEGITRDGRIVAIRLFSFTHYELVIIEEDGTLSTVLPEDDGAGQQRGFSLSPDGRFVLFEYIPEQDSMEDGCYMVDISLPVEDRVAVPVQATSRYDSAAFFSPDGTWITYVTDASGANQVVARPFDPENPGARTRAVLVSTDGGRMPQWNPDGTELFFENPNDRGIYSVSVTDEPDGGKTFGTPKLVLTDEQMRMHRNFGYRQWSYMPREDAFVFVRENENADAATADYIMNWTSTLPGAGR